MVLDASNGRILQVLEHTFCYLPTGHTYMYMYMKEDRTNRPVRKEGPRGRVPPPPPPKLPQIFLNFKMRGNFG